MAEAEKNEYAEQIGARIRTARKEFSMSQEELADLIQVSSRSMQAYERGEVIPYRKAKEIAGVLNRSVAWVLHGEEAQETAADLAPILQTISGQLERVLKLMQERIAA